MSKNTHIYFKCSELYCIHSEPSAQYSAFLVNHKDTVTEPGERKAPGVRHSLPQGGLFYV